MCSTTIPGHFSAALNAPILTKTRCEFLRRITSAASSSPPLLRVTRGKERLWSCSAARAKARDDDGTMAGDPEAPGEASGKQQGDDEVPRRKGAVQELFEGLYVCGYVLCYRLGELVWYNAQEAIAKLRKKR